MAQLATAAARRPHQPRRLPGSRRRLRRSARQTDNRFSYSPASQTLTQTRDNDSYAWTGAVPVTRNYTTSALPFQRRSASPEPWAGFANGLNQYTAAGAATFLYDANGNLTNDGTNSYLYDVENRLVSATIGAQAVSLRYDPMGAAAQGSGDAQHRWNGCGGRLYEVTGATTTRFLYDGDELVGEYATAGAMLKRYVHGIGVDDPVIQYDGSGIASTALRHLLADRQGSVIGIADSNGAILARNTYDEYGIPKSDQAGQAVVGRFAYTGQIWLPELGMYHYKARLYSPTLGRFLQTDPIGYDDQINLYAYVGNDPANASDPSGRATVCNSGRTSCTTTTDSSAPKLRDPVRASNAGSTNMASKDGLGTRAMDQASSELAGVLKQQGGNERPYRLDVSAGNGIEIVTATEIKPLSAGPSFSAINPKDLNGAEGVFHTEPVQFNETAPGKGDGAIPSTTGIPNYSGYGKSVSVSETSGGTHQIRPVNHDNTMGFQNRANEHQNTNKKKDE